MKDPPEFFAQDTMKGISNKLKMHRENFHPSVIAHYSFPDLIVPFINLDGVAKSPPYSVTAFFQDLDIPDVSHRP
jgi:hypothetical protein